MFKYSWVFYNEEKFVLKSASGITWASRSEQLNRAHLFSSTEHDTVTQYFTWGGNKVVTLDTMNEAVSMILKNSGRKRRMETRSVV